MKNQTITFCVITTLLLIAGCGEPPKPIKKEKVYIDQSYYDLREEEKNLYQQSGLTFDDTEVKRNAVMKQVTDEFHNRYIGKYVKWTGGYITNVEEVYGEYMCKIEMDKGAFFSTFDITISVSEQQAMELKKHKEVLIDGMIQDLSGSLKIEINDATLTYTGRTLNDMCGIDQ